MDKKAFTEGYLEKKAYWATSTYFAGLGGLTNALINKLRNKDPLKGMTEGSLLGVGARLGASLGAVPGDNV